MRAKLNRMKKQSELAHGTIGGNRYMHRSTWEATVCCFIDRQLFGGTLHCEGGLIEEKGKLGEIAAAVYCNFWCSWHYARV